MNTYAVWMELTRTLLRVRNLLAGSRAYHDVEQEANLTGSPEAPNVSWHLYLHKMKEFDLAIVALGKIKDLVARLIFERLGASLIANLDLSDPEWERSVTWAAVRKGLNKRIENQHVASLSQSDYEALIKMMDEFLSVPEGPRVWSYRLGVTHRIAPSVDRPELKPHFQSRRREPKKDASGNTTGWVGTITAPSNKCDFEFPRLYQDTVELFRHVVSMLEQLSAIPPFSRNATGCSSIAPKAQPLPAESNESAATAG